MIYKKRGLGGGGKNGETRYPPKPDFIAPTHARGSVSSNNINDLKGGSDIFFEENQTLAV